MHARVTSFFLTIFLMNFWIFQIKRHSTNDSNAFSSAKSGCVIIIGGAGEDRTPDPLRARQVLSQLSYNPIFFFAAIFPFTLR